MSEYRASSGTSGELIVSDSPDGYLHFYLRADNEYEITDIPWAYTLNGTRESWRSTTLQPGGHWQRQIILWVGYSQTVTFHLGETGSTDLGGPQDLSLYVTRGGLLGAVRINVGNQHKRAIPYIKVDGVWRQAEPWSKYVGAWKQTT